eukprot:19807-Heterococcus_DN1.PRE.3
MLKPSKILVPFEYLVWGCCIPLIPVGSAVNAAPNKNVQQISSLRVQIPRTCSELMVLTSRTAEALLSSLQELSKNR